MNSYLVDGIGEVTIVNGVVRIEFFVLVPDRSKPEDRREPMPAPALTVGIPLNVFSPTVDILSQVQKEVAGHSGQGRADAAGKGNGEISPNFS